MKAYPDYRSSGIEWLGKIPSHWDCVRTSWVFDYLGSGTTPLSSNHEYYENGNINWLQTGDLNDGFIESTSKKITKKALEDKALKIYPKGSLVIAMYGATIAKLGLLKIETTVNQACCVLTHSNKVLSKYAYYFYIAAKDELISLGSGGGQPNISQSTISNFKMVIPSELEQKAIVVYLDEEIGKVDALIAEKKKQVNDLRTYRTSLITETVTHGLNPEVSLKDSGIDRLSNIPVHWDIVRIKYISELSSGTNITSDEIIENGYPVFGGNGIRGFYSQYNHDGDFVLIGRQGALCGNINYARGKFWATEHAVVCHPIKEYALIWFGELLRIMNLNQYSLASAQPGLSVERIKNLQIPFPPLSEQREIAEYLDSKTEKIDKLISELEKQLEDLALYKKAVITETVTGKVDVRDWIPKK